MQGAVDGSSSLEAVDCSSSLNGLWYVIVVHTYWLWLCLNLIIVMITFNCMAECYRRWLLKSKWFAMNWRIAPLLFNLLNAVMPHWHVLLDGSIDVLCCISVKLNAVMPHRHVLLDCSSVLIFGLTVCPIDTWVDCSMRPRRPSTSRRW